MYRKKIKFTDYNGVEQEREYLFNLSRAELLEMELLHPEGLGAWIERLVQVDDRATIIQTFKDIILNSYGIKDETGLRFVKSPEISEAFYQSEAYTELFLELVSDADAAAKFVNGIVASVSSESPDKPAIAAK